jgi:hypothetical protein
MVAMIKNLKGDTLWLPVKVGDDGLPERIEAVVDAFTAPDHGDAGPGNCAL